MEVLAMQTKHPTPSAVPPEGVVACEVCLTEIPSSVAKSHGGEEYVHYFCGEHCYVQWKELEQEAAKKDTVST
jgi:YHS domain-containing protein